MGFPKWEPATHCTDGPRPGALALMKWFVEEYGDEGGYNLGIYNCRDIVGGSTTSIHGEGRADDFGFPVGDADGDDCLARLLKVPGRLGIQCIIYERVIYSALSPGGRPYTGLNPHYDHLHVELTRESGEHLTYSTVVDVMTPGLPRHKRGTRDLHIGMTGTDVRWLQRELGIEDDGVFGPRTSSRVRRFEENHLRRFPRLQVDGVVGIVTWKALGVNPQYTQSHDA